jgi:predicted ATPase
MKRGETDEVRAAWTLLEGLVHRVAPFIATLDPELVSRPVPTSGVRLYWTDERGDRFDAYDPTDGTLRVIALFAALVRPPGVKPGIVLFDEPELGLNSAAIALFAGLVRSVSAHSQVPVATQSPTLLDAFAVDEVIVAERRGGETCFRRLDLDEVSPRLADYSLAQLYEKYLLGGRP